jgi:hypothetical protein
LKGLHVHTVALCTTWYNFARVNSAIRILPATASGFEKRLWDIGDIVKLIEEWEVADEPQATVNVMPAFNERTSH